MLKRLRNIRRGVRVAFCCSICGSVPAVREARLFITADTGTWDTRLFLSLSLFSSSFFNRRIYTGAISLAVSSDPAREVFKGGKSLLTDIRS